MEEDGGGVPPDELRCRRSDGRKWRCERHRLAGKVYCETHYFKMLQVQERKKMKMKKAKQVVVGEEEIVFGGKEERINGVKEKRKKVKKEGMPEEVLDGRKRKIKRENDSDSRKPVPEVIAKSVKKQRCKDSKEEEKEGSRSILGDEVLCRRKKKVLKGREQPKKNLSVGKKTDDSKSIHLEEVPRVTEMPAEKNPVEHKQKISPLGKLSDDAKQEALLPIPPEDELQCCRTDGKLWRCVRQRLEGKSFCQVHHIQSLMRQRREKVPEELKIQRKYGKKTKPARSSRILSLEAKRRWKKRREVPAELSKKLDNVLKQMKMEKKEFQGEMMKTAMVKESEKELRRGGGVLVRDLPSGVMTVGQVSTSGRHSCFGGLKNLEAHSEGRLKYFNSGPSLFKCRTTRSKNAAQFRSKNPNLSVVRSFRSKNSEVSLVPADAEITCNSFLSDVQIGTGTNSCHRCHRKDAVIMMPCPICRANFCQECIQRWHSDLSIEDVRRACPLCRRQCDCIKCAHLHGRFKELVIKTSNANRISHAHYLLCLLLPVLKQIIQERRHELELQSELEGCDVKLLHIQLNAGEHHRCANCNNFILDLHRSCPKCSYDLCINCCREMREINLYGGMEAVFTKYCNKGRAQTLGSKPIVGGIKQLSSKRLIPVDSYPQLPILLRAWRTKFDKSVPCSPRERGGCGNCGGNMQLMHLFPLEWMSLLEGKADEAACCYDFPGVFDGSAECSLCVRTHNKLDKDKGTVISTGQRQDSHDNYLYSPTNDLQHEDLEHFQQHWSRGHPVVVRDVLSHLSGLSWEPKAILDDIEKKYDKLGVDSKTIKVVDCLDGHEVDIDIQEFLEGYYEGRAHRNMWPEMLKLDSPGNVFEKWVAANQNRLLSLLPFQEYTNHFSGHFNLMARLPQDFKPEVRAKTCISYGFPEELGCGDSVTKLHYDMFDTVNILTHVAEVPLSSEQQLEIDMLKRRHRAESEKELCTGCFVDLKLYAKVNCRGPLVACHRAGLKRRINGECDLSESRLGSIAGDCLELEDDMFSAEDLAKGITDSSLKRHKIFANPQVFVDDHSKVCASSSFPQPKVDSGAQWDVFRREDVPKLLEYISRHLYKFRHSYRGPVEHVINPLYDDSFFLDASHLRLLKDEYQIEPWTFQQHVGEAIFIPAGCPYQVRDLKSNMKVSLDFISPESARHCIMLADELRNLPRQYKAQQQTLDVKKMVVYNIDAAVAEIKRLTSR